MTSHEGRPVRRTVRSAGGIALALTTIAVADLAAQEVPGTGLERPSHRPYPLHCRGGDRLAFDTVRVAGDSLPYARLWLTFAAGAGAAGRDGEGLAPGTCAWVDRPLNEREPLKVRFAPAIGDSTPRLSMRDSSIYWSFLTYYTDSGHLEGVGHRHWRAGAAPAPHPQYLPHSPRIPASAEADRIDPRNLRFGKYLPMVLAGWVLFVIIPILTLTGRWTGWHRLAGLYPARVAGQGRRFLCGSLIMGRWCYRNMVRFAADDTHLHFRTIVPFIPGHPRFSVPWSDIAVSPDEWPWFPLRGLPAIRLTLGRDPGLRIILRAGDAKDLIAVSKGRLRLRESKAPAVPA